MTRSNCRHCGVEGSIEGDVRPCSDGEYRFICNRCVMRVFALFVWHYWRKMGTPMLIGGLGAQVFLAILGLPTFIWAGFVAFSAVIVIVPVVGAYKILPKGF